MKLPALPASPGVSVIVNTLNRMGSLENTLLGLRQLRYPDFEIVVVHGPCTDETLAILERHRDAIRIASCPIMNLSASRNIGLRLAAKDLVAFIDDDAVPEPDWLDRLVTGFSNPEVAAVGGFIRDQDGVAFQHQIIVANRLGDARSFAPPASPLGRGAFFSPTGTNICIRRACLAHIGGFDEAFAYFLEETDVNLRLVDRGWTIGFVPDAEVHHYFLENEVRNKTRVPRSLYQLARSKAYFCWKHGPGHLPTSEIHRRLARHRAQLRRHLVWFQFTGQLSGADARRLRSELDLGLADGEHTARQASGVAATFAGALPVDPTPAPPARRDRRARVCWISAPASASTGDAIDVLPLELAGLGGEVTAISPAAGSGTSIRFDGAWRHRVGSGAPKQLGFWRRYAAAALREVERIQPRRCFDIVVCPRELEAALAPLSARGIMVLASSALTAHDLNAAIRSAPAAQPR